MQPALNPSKPFNKVVAGLIGAIALIGTWLLIRTFFLGPEEFRPHASCYLYDQKLIWLHVISDALIGLAYASISLTLVYLVQKANVPFHLAFIAFGVFIGACGCTHFMEVWTVWEPHYWLSGGIKVVTAAASVATAVWLFPLLPQAMNVIKGQDLAEERRQKLEATYKELNDAHKELTAMYDKTRELDQIKTDFFANVSHELRTPLALILGPARQMLRSPALPESDRQHLESVERNAQLLLNHVNDLLDLSKLDARRMGLNAEQIDLAQLVRMIAGYFDSLARERSVHLQIEAPGRLMLNADADKLQRVLFNLLSNAFKFTPSGGRIICRVAEANGHAVIDIVDNGPGVPAHLRQTIFERFRQADSGPTRNTGGTGLGLAIVKEFVQLHGGIASVAETPGGGATFTVNLPGASAASERHGKNAQDMQRDAEAIAIGTLAALRQQQAPSKPKTAPTAADSTGPLVLVVEDNVDMNDFIAGALSAEARVERAYNGRDGLKMAVTLQPDVVVSDVMMPQMSGDQLLKELKERPETRDIPVILLTAKADDEMRVSLLRAGAQDFLTKPALIEEVRARVGNLVAMKRSRDVLQKELATTGKNIEAMVRALASRRREADAARKTAESANRAKDEFLMVLSHELRTPLTPILGWARMLQKDDRSLENVAHGSQVILRNAKSLLQLIEDLLDVSRIIAGKLRLEIKAIEVQSPLSAALESLKPLADARNIRIVTEFHERNLPVNGDATRLQQVFWNLLTNAAKFTQPGGTITVSTRANGQTAQVAISDTGKGISPEFLPFLFERFRQQDTSTTRTFGGLGLGLAIVRHLVELHGGTVRAESAGAGQGATFIVEMPLLGMQPTRTDDTPQPLKMPSLAGCNIVIVEDDADTREMITIILTSCGAAVRAFETSAEAIEAIKTQRPDVLVSDIGLPNEDGIQFIKRLRQRSSAEGGDVPAIALTAFAHETEREAALTAGFQIHQAKPVNPDNLAQAILSLWKK